jgi:Flp pilus assembly protein TadG
VKPAISLRAFRRRCRNRGATAVEFALILPILLLCVLGLIEFARAVWTQATLDYVVEAAARCAAVDSLTCGTVAKVQNYAAAKAAGLSFADPTSTFHVTTPSCGALVTASLQFGFLVPALLPYLPTLGASACFPCLSGACGIAQIP